jgi:hypothetical protein
VTRGVAGERWLILRRNWIASLRSRDRQQRIQDRVTAAAIPVTPLLASETVVYDMLAGLPAGQADVAEAPLPSGPSRIWFG